jgi:hypothetical protein
MMSHHRKAQGPVTDGTELCAVPTPADMASNAFPALEPIAPFTAVGSTGSWTRRLFLAALGLVPATISRLTISAGVRTVPGKAALFVRKMMW